MSIINPISIQSTDTIISLPRQETGRFRFLTFLNEENGGPGADAVNAAVITGIVLTALPYLVGRLFPEWDDGRLFAQQRMYVGIRARECMQHNPGLSRLMHMVQDSIPLTSSLYVLFQNHPRFAHVWRMESIAIFPSICLFTFFGRLALHTFVMLGVEHGSQRVQAIASKIEVLIRPNGMNERPENVWTPEFTNKVRDRVIIFSIVAIGSLLMSPSQIRYFYGWPD